MNFASNIRFLRKKFNLSQQDAAEKLSIPRTTLGDYERGHTEPNFDLLVKICKMFSIPLDELLQTDLSAEGIEYLKLDHLKIVTLTVNSEGKNNIELVSTKAAAGYISGYAETEFIRELPKISIPKLNQGSYRAFEIQGDSMLPIPSGSIIITEYVEKISYLKDNKTYVVVSQKEGIVFKRISKNSDKQQLILSSDNSEYLPYTIDFTDISEIWSYAAHISFQEPNPMQNDILAHQIKRLEAKIDALK